MSRRVNNIKYTALFHYCCTISIYYSHNSILNINQIYFRQMSVFNNNLYIFCCIQNFLLWNRFNPMSKQQNICIGSYCIDIEFYNFGCFCIGIFILCKNLQVDIRSTTDNRYKPWNLYILLIVCRYSININPWSIFWFSPFCCYSNNFQRIIDMNVNITIIISIILSKSIFFGNNVYWWITW